MLSTFRLTAAAMVLAGPLQAAPIDIVSDAFTSFVSFGDSLTDNGKFGIVGLNQTPPYDDGRFTNGEVWQQIVADGFGSDPTLNLALGGATARNSDEIPGLPFEDFGSQISTLQAALAFGFDPGDNPLISVWLGANDLFRTLDGPDFLDQARLTADIVADGVRRIAGLSDLFDDFLVFNVPDLGAIPAYNLFQTGLQQNARDATAAFNNRLAANLVTLDREDLTIIDIDAAGAIADLIDDAADLGITQTTFPCLFPSTALADGFGQPVNCTGGTDPALADTYL